METKEEVNRKLKSIYFSWGINYEGPFPRSYASNFREHLHYEYYDFDKNWLEKILKECNIPNQKEFDSQILRIEDLFKKYGEQQVQKRNKWQEKTMNKYFAKGIVPF